MGELSEAPKLKVREGGYYRRRDGRIVGPAEEKVRSQSYPWCVDGCFYTNEGFWWIGLEHQVDLVAEVPPPEAKAIAYPDLDVGEGYRRLQLGESVQAGDEMTYDWSEPVDHDLWRPVSEHWIGKVIHEDFVPVRRSHLSAHERMMYLLAEHLFNPSGIGLHAWAVRGCDLLAEVQQMDPEKYAKYVSQQDGAP